jgi:hypothetical protein
MVRAQGNSENTNHCVFQWNHGDMKIVLTRKIPLFGGYYFEMSAQRILSFDKVSHWMAYYFCSR